MRELTTEIQLPFPIDQVWDVLTDIEHWTDWNPTVKKAGGSSAMGSKLSITIDGGGERDASYTPTVVELDGPRRFRWRTKMMGGLMFTNDRVFELTEKDGGTHLVHKEAFGGLMVPMMWKKLSGFVVPNLEKMNEALKTKLEQ